MCVNEGVDLISTLPDQLLGAIVSLLPGTEGVRTCVLSQRWKMVWKHTLHLNINESQMLEPNEGDMDEIVKAERLINSVLDSHSGSVKSCNIQHLPKGCTIEKIGVWIKKIIELKTVKKLSMEVENHVHWNHVRVLEEIAKVCNVDWQQVYKYYERDFPFETFSDFEDTMWIEKIIELKRVKKLSMKVHDHVDWTHVRSLEALKEFLKVSGVNVDWVKVLDEYFGFGRRDFPFEIFPGFEALELKNYRLKTSPSDNVSCQVLRTLTLRKVSVSKDTWGRILSYCFCLENLTLDDCYFTQEVKIDSPSLKFFRICRMVLRELEVFAVNLEIFEIDTVVCLEKYTFETPKVHVLRICYDVKMGQRNRNNLLLSRKILYTCGNNHGPQGSTSSCSNIFENLATLSIDLDLKEVMNAAALFSALKACPVLQNLEINSQVDDAWYYNSDEQDDDNKMMPYPEFSSWKQREFCECIKRRLKTLSIKGFAGEDTQVEFLEYIITTVEVMEKITIWFVDDCSWSQAIKAICLQSLSASQNFSMIFKPGPLYMANGDDNFQTWVSTLRNY